MSCMRVFFVAFVEELQHCFHCTVEAVFSLLFAVLIVPTIAHLLKVLLQRFDPIAEFTTESRKIIVRISLFQFASWTSWWRIALGGYVDVVDIYGCGLVQRLWASEASESPCA